MFALDADFVVSAGLHERLSSPEAAEALAEDLNIHRNIVVIPAFETESSLGLEKGGEIATRCQHSASSILLSSFFYTWRRPIYTWP